MLKKIYSKFVSESVFICVWGWRNKINDTGNVNVEDHYFYLRNQYITHFLFDDNQTSNKIHTVISITHLCNEDDGTFFEVYTK